MLDQLVVYAAYIAGTFFSAWLGWVITASFSE